MSKEYNLGKINNAFNKVYFLGLEKQYTIEEIEKRIVALEIIKEKRVRVPYLMDLLETGYNGDKLEMYNTICDELTKEEFDLLKEVLL